MLDALFVGMAVENVRQAANQAGAMANRASSAAEQSSSQVSMMQMDVEKLYLITQALWIMLRDEHGYTDEQLIQKVQEIDMSDGRLDGKVAKQAPVNCPHCGRAMSVRRTTCMYCGGVSANDPFKR